MCRSALTPLSISKQHPNIGLSMIARVNTHQLDENADNIFIYQHSNNTLRSDLIVSAARRARNAVQ